ncbi:hypothetical protein M9Y10_000607 [Tritrichomonas musculus]|uniref:HECT domain-containing protein n=1 Tax=Tritrichomonas musculus TaxID=1915356 RepID=A0ABR2L5K2_9EUKA
MDEDQEPFDVDDFMISTEFVEPLTAENQLVEYFFNAISKWDEDDLESLFTLVTGSYLVPKKDFKDFFSSIGSSFKIGLLNDTNGFPEFHSHETTLLLPDYKSEDELNRNLIKAVHICDGLALS